MKMRAPVRIGFDHEAPEKPPRMIRADSYTRFVAAAEAGVQALRKEAARCKAANAFTDMEQKLHLALLLETLAHAIDERRRP